jgi:hypothetical protein
VTFDLSPQPAGSRLREESTAAGPALWRASLCSARLQLDIFTLDVANRPGNPLSTLRGNKSKSLKVQKQFPSGTLKRIKTSLLGPPKAIWWALENPRPASPFAGGPARRLFGGRDVLSGNENKPLTARSNRNTNESHNTTTLSESTTSKFLIATKLHFSEEKAKSEERVKLLLPGDARKPTCALPQRARLASEHSRGALSGRCNVTAYFPIDFAGAGRNSICPSRTGSN